MGGRRIQPFLFVLVLLLGLAACGGEPGFGERSVTEVEHALEDAGLSVCASTSPGEPVANATAERALTISFDCGDAGQATVVELIAWPDQGARDAAIRRFEVQSRPSSQADGLQLALGQFTIAIDGTRDEDVTSRAIDALKGLGAA